MVFVCVFMVALLIFVLSVLNLGSITNDKVRLQNAADFSALSGSVWQARAMNLEGLFNTTVTISFGIEIARCIFTGTPPSGLPPKWIELQMDAQQWIQEGFNKYWFGTGMVLLTGAMNSEITIPKPYKVPLYVYRYSFAAAAKDKLSKPKEEQEDGPTDGAGTFEKESNDGLDKYSKNSDYDDIKATAQDDQGEDGDTGLISWSEKYTLFEDKAYPASDGDMVPLILGDGTNPPSSFNVSDFFSKNPGSREQLVNKATEFVNKMIDQNFRKNTNLNEATLEQIKKNTQEQLNKKIEELFTVPADSVPNITIELPYLEYTAGSPMASILFRILPSFEFKTGFSKGKPKLMDENFKAGDSAGLKAIGDIEVEGCQQDRYFNPEAIKEFWEYNDTTFSWIGSRGACQWDSKTGKATKWTRRAKCDTCKQEKTSKCLSMPPSSAKSLFGSEHYDTSPGTSDKHLACSKRAWFYPSVRMTFVVEITADLNLDLSAILMGKYRGSQDYCQIKDGGKNQCVKEVVDEYWNKDTGEDDKDFYGRNLYVMALRVGRELPFAHKLMAIPEGVENKDIDLPNEDLLSPNENSLYRSAIKQGKLPFTFAFSSGQHWQRGDQVKDDDKTNKPTFGNYYNKSTVGSPVYYEMSWHGAPYIPNAESNESQIGRDEIVGKKFEYEIKKIRNAEELANLVLFFNESDSLDTVVKKVAAFFNINSLRDDYGNIEMGGIEGKPELPGTPGVVPPPKDSNPQNPDREKITIPPGGW
jgi:hypothetical protein